jgi:endonuclease/exonuclease/phosphatase family metal-dependent hydrolase
MLTHPSFFAIRRIAFANVVGVLTLGLLFGDLLSAKKSARGDEAQGARPLRVMSFNIRYATANDGMNAWPLRRELLLETIKAFAPDLLGTQETLQVQADFLKERLPEYTIVGVGREDGKQKGEQSALLFKTDRFELLESGHFWLSETPEVPGSKSWDSALPRMVTWVRLADRSAGGKKLCYLNTHFDHQGQQARVESARLMRRWIGEHAADEAVVVTGDFNATESNEVYEVLIKSREQPVLLDAYRIFHPNVTLLEGSFHGFTGTRNGLRIDLILHTEHFQPTEAAIDYTNRDGMYPSDHYPVTAVLNYAE